AAAARDLAAGRGSDGRKRPTGRLKVVVDRAPSLGRRTGPARHEWPEVDEAALVAARQADYVLSAARDQGSRRWQDFFERVPDQLRDDSPRQLRSDALRV